MSIPLALGAGLILGTNQAWAYQIDPDTAVDPASVHASVPQLVAPNATIGDADTTVSGVGLDTIGIGASLANPPAEPADPPSANTLYVDLGGVLDNDSDCPATPYSSIQAAVDVSGVNDTILVCPDLYPEQVKISGHSHDGLKLVSLTPLGAVIQWPGIPNVLNHQLVDVKNADRVSIRGFTITGPFVSGGCSDDRHEGVRFENAFHGRVAYNHITLIRDSLAANYGCQQGEAVSIGERLPVLPPIFGAAASALVDHNWIDKYQKNGVQVLNQGSFAVVQNNTITASSDQPALQLITAENGVVVFRNAGAIVDYNMISDNKFTPVPTSRGIILRQAPNGSSRADHNRVFNNDFGIDVSTQIGLEVSHNDVFGNVSDGIALCGDAGSGCGPVSNIVVRANDVHGNGGSGVLLLSAVSNLVKVNHINNNGTAGPDTTDGLRVDVNSAGNMILGNQLSNNVTHDCHDDSIGSGSGTPPTANTWQGNQGQTANRAGICSPPPPCQEGDGNGDFHGDHGDGNFSSDNDGCKDGDQDSVQSTNRGDGKNFQSTRIDSMKFDSLANTMTISGAGLAGGLPVTFVFVALESGPITPGWVSFTFSDGYSNAGTLLNGSVLLH